MTISFYLQQDEGGETEGLTPDTYEKTLRYFAHVTDNETYDQVRVAALNELPTRYFNLIRTSVSVPRRITFDTIYEVVLEFRHPGGGGYFATPITIDDTKVTFRSSGDKTDIMKFSYEAFMLHPGNEKPVLLDAVQERAINLEAGDTGETVIKGVDIDLTSITMVVETVKPGSVVTPRYLINCALARGKVNAFPYKGFPRGSLRLVSFEAAEQTNPGTSTSTPVDEPPNWNLSFVFDFKPPVSGKMPMDDLQGNAEFVPYKFEGHWYFDARTVKKPALINVQKNVDDQLKVNIPVMKYGMVHRIYEYEDFELLLQI